MEVEMAVKSIGPPAAPLLSVGQLPQRLGSGSMGVSQSRRQSRLAIATHALGVQTTTSRCGKTRLRQRTPFATGSECHVPRFRIVAATMSCGLRTETTGVATTTAFTVVSMFAGLETGGWTLHPSLVVPLRQGI